MYMFSDRHHNNHDYNVGDNHDYNIGDNVNNNYYKYATSNCKNRLLKKRIRKEYLHY
jgi:hypothetical protein